MSFIGQAQKAIYGNGNIEQDIRSVKMFSKLEINFNGDVIIHLGEQPKVIVQTDQNILQNITTMVKGTKLVIDQKDWPEPSKKFIVHVYTPMITEIVSDSWTNITMKEIDQKKLTVNIEQGSFIGTGSVENLVVHSEQGKFDLKNLTVQNADIKLRGYADMTMCCVESLKKNIADGADFKVLNGSFAEDVKQEPKIELKYINFEIVNNSWTRNHFVVRGPKGHKFSYGFPMNPGFTREERWPVGTKVFKTNLVGLETVLIEVTAEDENKKVKLFQD